MSPLGGMADLEDPRTGRIRGDPVSDSDHPPSYKDMEFGHFGRGSTLLNDIFLGHQGWIERIGRSRT